MVQLQHTFSGYEIIPIEKSLVTFEMERQLFRTGPCTLDFDAEESSRLRSKNGSTLRQWGVLDRL